MPDKSGMFQDDEYFGLFAPFLTPGSGSAAQDDRKGFIYERVESWLI